MIIQMPNTIPCNLLSRSNTGGFYQTQWRECRDAIIASRSWSASLYPNKHIPSSNRRLPPLSEGRI